MTRLSTLLSELQALDLRLDENAAARAALAAKLADSSSVTSARDTLDSTEKVRTDLKARLRTLELETAGLAAKLREVNERLYSGRITNPKELAGLNQDEKFLQRHKSELEDQELALMEQIEQADSTSETQRAAFEQISRRANEQNHQDRRTLDNLQAAAGDLQSKRDALAARLPAETLATYQELRRTKKGRAVASLQAGSCGACGYQVPSGLLSRITMGNEIILCGNCGRILTS